MTTPKKSENQNHRPDDMVLAEIWQTIWNVETIRVIDFHDISIDVENGQVCLTGHVSQDSNKQRIEEIAQSVPGVIAVHNHLVGDSELKIQVAQALGNRDCTRPYIIPVQSYHGWVNLGGLVPHQDIQNAAEETAASVPAVRGLIQLPEIEGEHNPSLRHAVQPGIGVRVYGENEIMATVHQVVISPRNRLVSLAIVLVDFVNEDHAGTISYLIPVEAMKVINDGGILLNDNTPLIEKFPVFTPANYPIAPLTWQPPYPYTVGSVRWPRLEKMNAESHSAVNTGKAVILSKIGHRDLQTKEM